MDNQKYNKEGIIIMDNEKLLNNDNFDTPCDGCLYACIGECSAPVNIFWTAMKNNKSCCMRTSNIDN